MKLDCHSSSHSHSLIQVGYSVFNSVVLAILDRGFLQVVSCYKIQPT